jgi:hypothetical protein
LFFDRRVSGYRSAEALRHPKAKFHAVGADAESHPSKDEGWGTRSATTQLGSMRFLASLRNDKTQKDDMT